MARRFPNTRGPSVTTNIPIYTLSGGVSRQAQSKRLPNEAENMDNALVSLERSFEKRPGFETVIQYSASNIWNNNAASSVPNANRIDLFPLSHAVGTAKDYWFYWFNINEDNRFLVVIDYKATLEDDVLIYSFRIKPDGTWSDETQYLNYSGTYSQSGTTVTVTASNHGLLVGNSVKITSRTGTTVLGTYTVTAVTNANTFTYTSSSSLTTSGTIAYNNLSITNADTRAYITYGSSTNNAKDVLKATTVGNSIIIVNTLVYAGFTSGESGWNGVGTGGKLFTLAGVESGTTDTTGTKLTYYSSARYTKGSNSYWYLNTQTGTSTTITGTLTVGSTVTLGAAPSLPTGLTYGTPTTTPVAINPSTQSKVYAVNSSGSIVTLSNWGTNGTTFTVEAITQGSTAIVSGGTITAYSGYFVEVEDFIWHDATQPWFGQSLADFSEIRFPPENAEVNGNNGIVLNSVTYDNTAKTVLNALYGTSSGNGKIYYTAAPYLNFTSGYYRIISSTTKPYTKKVRSPDCYSVVDKKRMPQKIIYNAAATLKWTANPINWEPRTSGNRYSNPGPSIFLADDKVTPRQVQIKAISTFRDRLYFAAEDVVFTSQLGVYEDLFLADPSNIVSTDPIDVRASSNTFSEISSLTPFNTYLFINTLGNVQYELKGSQNQITPLTAEISPTAFYSTAKFIEPQLMGSLIYFFDSSKLYLYLSSESADLAVAQELTVTCPDYLPNTYRSICVAPAQNYIIMSDNASQNYLYFHASRFAGDRNLQNAFFRYVLNTNDSILSNQSYNDYLYSVIKRPTADVITVGTTTATTVGGTPAGAATQTNRYYLEKSYLRSYSPSIPRLDRMIKIKLYDNNSDYTSDSNQTKIRVPITFPYADISNIQLITDSTWTTDVDGDRAYEVVSPTAYFLKDTYIELIFNGRFVPINSSRAIDYTIDRNVYIGIKFTMEVELSTQFVRDQNNNAIEGSLNLRSITLRHKNTGNYDVQVSNRGRTALVSKFTNQRTDDNQDLLNLENYEEEGEFTANILGFSDSTQIKIVSDYPTPVNIVNMELAGKFIQKSSPTA